MSLVLLGLQGTLGCRSKTSTTPFDLSAASYVGKTSCVKCHQEQAQLYSGSHHEQAMQLASDATVRADFENATLTHHGVESRMFRDGTRFIVHTEGPDGQMQDFEVKYVFGLEPLQQYMVEFPSPSQNDADDSTIPRIQVLRLCWDTEKEEWFYLPPPDVPEKLDPHDDLHWTGIAQRWNNMCAECHSTDYKKNFELPSAPLEIAATDDATAQVDFGKYNSTFMEINVSCESCHGPGSVHVELAQKTFPGWSRERGYGLANLKLSPENQIQACAPCHSRRNVIQAGFQAGDDFYDFYSNQLLTDPIYYPDGQILDEDYVHGSFIQSKMYHKGIKCSDCHDPHSARLKHDGNQVCTSCHQHPAAKYDSVGHHFHQPNSPGAQCVNCHMPSTTYMEVDARRDHSFRIPRPDLSTELGTPNACTGCHLTPENISPEKQDSLRLYQDWMTAARDGDAEVQAELERANAWCDAACDKWYGENRRRDPHFGIAIDAGQKGKPNAVSLLEEVLEKRGYEAPYIARATALQVLAQVDPAKAAKYAERALEDPHPLVRSTATSTLIGAPNFSKSIKLLEKALEDEIRSVRVEAARNLLEYPIQNVSSAAAPALRTAINELTVGLNYNNDRAGAHLALGILAEQQGRIQQAIQAYEDAIKVEPNVTGARTNLAALLERNLSQQAGTIKPDLAKALRKQIDGLRKAELPLLERDANLLPEVAALQYRLGLAFYVDGQLDKAATHLVNAANLEPEQVAYCQSAAMIFESMKQWDEAIEWCRKAIQLSGGDPGSLSLLERIEASKNAATEP